MMRNSRKNSMFKNWFRRHRDLREEVAAAITSSAPDGSLICALECRYLPHGGKDEVWITLTAPHGGNIKRVRSFYLGETVNLSRPCAEDEAASIRQKLRELGAWSLGDFEGAMVIDGSPCAIVLAEAQTIRSIQANNAEGEHLRLIEYILGLLPVADRSISS